MFTAGTKYPTLKEEEILGSQFRRLGLCSIGGSTEMALRRTGQREGAHVDGPRKQSTRGLGRLTLGHRAVSSCPSLTQVLAASGLQCSYSPPSPRGLEALGGHLDWSHN